MFVTFAQSEAGMKDVAQLLSSITTILWPTGILVILWWFRAEIRGLLTRNSQVGFKFLGAEVILGPSAVERRPEGNATLLAPISKGSPMPADYLFLNHVSFLRPEKQDEFQKVTGVQGIPHYDIQVQLDSYYEGALDRVEYVLYVLHQSYPEPIQARSRRSDKFLLKEVANGEYVMLAKVYLRDQNEPLILQRYITLWKEGPRLPNEPAPTPDPNLCQPESQMAKCS